MKSLKIACVVTGKTTLYGDQYLQKKLEEYGGQENLLKYYVCRDVRTLLKKGYNVKEIVKILNIPADFELPPSDVIKEIEKDYTKNEYNTNTTNGILSGIADLTNDKSDPEVENFFANIFRKVTA